MTIANIADEITNRVVSDPSERRLTFVREQDCEDILNRNAELRAMPQRSDWGRHKASIPNIIYEKWFNEYNEGRAKPDLRLFGQEFGEFVNKKLNDPNWAYLRVDNPANQFTIGYR